MSDEVKIGSITFGGYGVQCLKCGLYHPGSCPDPAPAPLTWVWPVPNPRTSDAAICPVCGYKHHGAMCPATYGTKIAALEAQIAQLRERLEIGFAFDGDGNRISVGDDMPDGIECRDETIRLQDEENARLRRKVRKLKAKRREAREAYSRLYGLWKFADRANAKDWEIIESAMVKAARSGDGKGPRATKPARNVRDWLSERESGVGRHE